MKKTTTRPAIRIRRNVRAKCWTARFPEGGAIPLPFTLAADASEVIADLREGHPKHEILIDP